jgi:hypothetical protein
MARTPATFKQGDAARAWRAAEAAGRKVLRTEFKKDGTIVLVHDETPDTQPEPGPTPPAEIVL